MAKQQVECGKCRKKFWSRVLLGVPIDIYCRQCTNRMRSKQRQPMNRKLRRLKKYHPKQFEKLMEKQLPKVKQRIDVKVVDGKPLKKRVEPKGCRG